MNPSSRSSSRFGVRLALAVTLLLSLAPPARAQGEVQPRELAALAPPAVAGTYPAGSADFGPDLPPGGVTGLLVHVEDAGTESGESCGAITNAEALDGAVAFVRRGECGFCDKVTNVDLLTDAVAVAIYNDERVPDSDTTVFDMLDGFCSPPSIPSVFVSRATGLLLLGAMETDPVTVRLQPATPTDTEDGPDAETLALAAYPNPASGPVTLALTLPGAADVRVEAFDVLGRRVALVHDGPLGAGPHALRLAAGVLPAGVYVVQATAGASSVTSRIAVH